MTEYTCTQPGIIIGDIKTDADAYYCTPNKQYETFIKNVGNTDHQFCPYLAHMTGACYAGCLAYLPLDKINKNPDYRLTKLGTSLKRMYYSYTITAIKSVKQLRSCAEKVLKHFLHKDNNYCLRETLDKIQIELGGLATTQDIRKKSNKFQERLLALESEN